MQILCCCFSGRGLRITNKKRVPIPDVRTQISLNKYGHFFSKDVVFMFLNCHILWQSETTPLLQSLHSCCGLGKSHSDALCIHFKENEISDVFSVKDILVEPKCVQRCTEDGFPPDFSFNVCHQEDNDFACQDYKAFNAEQSPHNSSTPNNDPEICS